MENRTRTVLGTAFAVLVGLAAGPLGAGEISPEAVSVQRAFDKALIEQVEQAPSIDELVAEKIADAQPMDADTLCVAKAVHHEAANQPLHGQLAVAQLILNRAASGIFPKTACAVVNQRGQFFRIASYHAPRKDPRWQVSVAIARIAMDGDMDPVVPGALYYHANYVKPAWMMKRERVARIGAHIFYR